MAAAASWLWGGLAGSGCRPEQQQQQQQQQQRVGQ
jgi:hypothetical protein